MNSSKSASFRLEDGRMSGVNDKKTPVMTLRLLRPEQQVNAVG